MDWRVIQDGPGEAAWNMALDEALLDSISANAAPPTLRLYRWERPCVSVGRFQDIARTLRLDVCERRGVPVVRRITGGRGILHGHDLTVSVAAPIAALGFACGEAPGTLALHERLAAGFLKALSSLGIRAGRGEGMPGRALAAQGDCFAVISRADIVLESNGRKIAGSALYRRGDTLLQQTSLPLLTAAARVWQERACTLLFCGATAEYSNGWMQEAARLDSVLAQSFAGIFGGSASVGTVSEEERRRASELMQTRYRAPDWQLRGARSRREEAHRERPGRV